MNVLIIEEEEALSSPLSCFLEGQGLDCRVAHNGREAVERCGRETYDVALLDLRLSDLSIPTVLEKLKKTSGRPLPVLLIAGDQEEAVRLRGSVSEKDDFILKPFDLEELFARVSNLLLA